MSERERVIWDLAQKLARWYESNTTTKLSVPHVIQSEYDETVELVGTFYPGVIRAKGEETTELGNLGAGGRPPTLTTKLRHLLEHPDDRVLLSWSHEEAYPVIVWEVRFS